MTFLWRNGKWSYPGKFIGADINNRGEVAGTEWLDSLDPASYPLIWKPDRGIIRLQIPKGYYFGLAKALNDAGQVVGAVYCDDGDESTRAVRWTKDRAVILSRVPSFAYDVNAKGNVVGVVKTGKRAKSDWEACLWVNRKEILLTDQLAADSSWQLLGMAVGINGDGQIIGNGIHDGRRCGYLLTPER